jgi:hypothetical protein
VGEARSLGLKLDLEHGREAMQRLVREALISVAEQPSAARVAEATTLIHDTRELGLDFGLWAVQNEFFDLWRRLPRERALLAPLADALGFLLPQEVADEQ